MSTLTLLVVDDDVVDRQAVQRALRAAQLDARVLEAATEAEALAAARDVDCVLLDYHLPGSDGLAVLRRLRAEGHDVPVIALTGHGDEQIAVELMKAGAADYLAKQSLTPDRLERSVRHALAIAGAERQRRELLRREQAAREEAQQANRQKDEFLATLSHELRTPLNAILGWTTLLARDDVDPQLFRRGLETIERNVRLQAKLIDDLLDVSRIVTGKLAIEREPVSLSPILSTVVESCRIGAESAGVTVHHSITGDEQPILGDATRLHQVVTNLLSNAIKFTPGGGRVDLDLAFQGPAAVLAVRDTGAGIDPSFLPYVFERFRQGDAPPGQRSGLGLGLAIVRHLVEAHGGDVTVESRGRGHGATFRVTLPTMLRGTTAIECAPLPSAARS